MWKPYIAIDAGKDSYGLEQARVVRFDAVITEAEAWSIAKGEFIKTPNSVAFSIKKNLVNKFSYT